VRQPNTLEWVVATVTGGAFVVLFIASGTGQRRPNGKREATGMRLFSWALVFGFIYLALFAGWIIAQLDVNIRWEK